MRNLAFPMNAFTEKSMVFVRFRRTVISRICPITSSCRDALASKQEAHWIDRSSGTLISNRTIFSCQRVMKLLDLLIGSTPPFFLSELQLEYQNISRTMVTLLQKSSLSLKLTFRQTMILSTNLSKIQCERRCANSWSISCMLRLPSG